MAFHLARSGYDWVETERNSPYGDLWLQIGKRKFGLEVKTSKKAGTWRVPLHQIARVDFYCFVQLHNARCYVLPSAEVAKLALATENKIEGTVAVLSDKDIPPDADGAWSILASKKPKEVKAPKKPTVYKWPRTVKKQLADGTVKEYKYPKTPVEHPAPALLQ